MELAEYIRDGGYEAVEMIGVCTDICVVSNALLVKAYVPELPVSVDASCCAGVTLESHHAALCTMRMCQILSKIRRKTWLKCEINDKVNRICYNIRWRVNAVSMNMQVFFRERWKRMNVKNYEDVDSWKTVMFLYNAALKEVGTKLEILNDEFQHVHRYNPIEHIKKRIKTPEKHC